MCVICIHTKTKVEDLRGAGLIVEDVIEARGDGADLWGLVPDKRLGIEQIGQLGGERATLLILTLVLLIGQLLLVLVFMRCIYEMASS